MADAVRDQGAGVGAAPPQARVDDGSSDDAPAAAKAPAATAPTAVQVSARAHRVRPCGRAAVLAAVARVWTRQLVRCRRLWLVSVYHIGRT